MPAAEYEVAVRFAEGHGVTQSYEAAALWFDRAAKRGLAPAQFRLGGFYEKGVGVKKDLAAARDLYRRRRRQGQRQGDAQSRGALRRRNRRQARLPLVGRNGSARPPTTASPTASTISPFSTRAASASRHNLAEAYKWFSLAAKEGDKDAAKKRDEVGSHLDQQSLNAARTAVQSWTPSRRSPRTRPPSRCQPAAGTPRGRGEAEATPRQTAASLAAKSERRQVCRLASLARQAVNCSDQNCAPGQHARACPANRR